MVIPPLDWEACCNASLLPKESHVLQDRLPCLDPKSMGPEDSCPHASVLLLMKSTEKAEKDSFVTCFPHVLSCTYLL